MTWSVQAGVSWGGLWLLVAAPMLAAGNEAAKPAAFDGEWRTSFGIVELKQTGDAVTGTYGNAGEFTIKGTVEGKTLTFEYQEGQARGDANWKLDEAEHSFRGEFKVRGGQAGRWQGWRPDPEAPKGKLADIGGLWLTDLGLMELEQDGDKVMGRYVLGRGEAALTPTLSQGARERAPTPALPGKEKERALTPTLSQGERERIHIEGTVTGRMFKFKYKAFRGERR